MELVVVKHLLHNYKKDIEKQLTALVSLSKRLKLPTPTWTFSDVYEHEFSVLLGSYGYGEDRDEEWETYIEPCFDITINVEETLKIDGNWNLVCAIDHRAKAMIQIDETAEIPMHYNPSNDCCEHCGLKSPRVKSFIVHNNNTKEFKQIGKTCLKQFLGVNPASYITMFEAVSKFSPIVAGYGMKNRGGRLDNLAYDVLEMFRYTVHQVAKDGQFVKPLWESRPTGHYHRNGDPIMKNFRTNEGEATLDKVKERLVAISFFRMNPNLRNDTTTIENLQERLSIANRRLGLFDKTDKNLSDNAKERIGIIQNTIFNINSHIIAIKNKKLMDENILPYSEEFANITKFITDLHIPDQTETMELSSFDQYKQLLKTVYLKKRTLQTNLKTIVSGYGYWLNELKREEESRIRKENAKNLAYVGTVGQKSELVLKITGLKTGVGGWGTWKLWSMEDENGNKFSKFGEIGRNYTIIEVNPNEEGADATIGSTVAITAVVKSHKEVKDEKVTELGKISQIKKAKYLYKELAKQNANEK